MSYRRRIRRLQANHTDDWLLTYADTITLLLCLFVVLLASQASKRVLPQDPLPAISVEQPVAAANFVDWTLLSKPMKPENEAPSDDASTDAEDRTTPPPEQDALLPAVAHGALAAAEQAIAAEPDPPPALVASIPQPAPALITPAYASLQQASGAPSVPLSEIVAHVTPEGPAHLEQDGDRITTLVFDSAAFFSRGAATLSSSGKVILQDVVGNLKSDKYRDYKVTIEGHTDDAPINTTQFPSNWELSAARAAAVVRFFLEQGVSAERLRAAGYADTRPLAPNHDANGIAMPANQARNRRVVIELEKIEHR